MLGRNQRPTASDRTAPYGRVRSGLLHLPRIAGLAAIFVAGAAPLAFSASGHLIGDLPTIRQHLDQHLIDQGRVRFRDLFDYGAFLFSDAFNTLDGFGRPEATGANVPTHRLRRDMPDNMNRSSGPDSNSCAGCHNQPRAGGSGDNVANVFVLSQRGEFNTSIGPDVADERNTVAMWGAGVIEMLAREMTGDLLAIKARAVQQAAQSGQAVTARLVTKGVDFGSITAQPNGALDLTRVEGVDTDLVVKPFNQKGTVVSLREFTVNAMNQHHGMEASERFGDGVDFDNDGVADELTRGDITAVTIFQAALAVPGQRLPADWDDERTVVRGQKTFETIGCANCHTPTMVLNDPVFSEPNPYNHAGTMGPAAGVPPFRFNLAREGQLPRPQVVGGHIVVHAFTDLKRHHMGPRCNNEVLVQDGVPTDVFITKKLWGVGNKSPFMHNGRTTLLGEAIEMHGGEAQPSVDAFNALTQTQRAEVVEFLKSLQVLPEGTPTLIMRDGGGRFPRG